MSESDLDSAYLLIHKLEGQLVNTKIELEALNNLLDMVEFVALGSADVTATQILTMTRDTRLSLAKGQ